MAKIELPHREDTIPLLGFKYARILEKGNKFTFASSVLHGGRFIEYDIVDHIDRLEHQSDVGREFHYRIPNGFYAMKSEESLENASYTYTYLFKLEVELYGTVYVHELGYRASHQRVLSVTLPSYPYGCASESDHMDDYIFICGPSSYFISGDELKYVCKECGPYKYLDDSKIISKWKLKEQLSNQWKIPVN